MCVHIYAANDSIDISSEKYTSIMAVESDTSAEGTMVYRQTCRMSRNFGWN